MCHRKWSRKKITWNWPQDKTDTSKPWMFRAWNIQYYFYMLHCSSSVECQNNMDAGCYMITFTNLTLRLNWGKWKDTCVSVIFTSLPFPEYVDELNIPYTALSLSVILLLVYWKLYFYECWMWRNDRMLDITLGPQFFVWDPNFAKRWVLGPHFRIPSANTDWC